MTWEGFLRLFHNAMHKEDWGVTHSCLTPTLETLQEDLWKTK